MDTNSKKIIADFINAKLAPKDFEAFLYAAIDIEAQLGSDIYLELISINYNSKHCRVEVENLMRPMLNYGEIHKSEILDCIDALLSGETKILDGLSELDYWAWMGYTFLATPEIVANYSDQGKSFIHMIDGTDSEQEILRKVERYQPDFWEFLRGIKAQLLDDRIILTGQKIQGRYHNFFDFLISA